MKSPKMNTTPCRKTAGIRKPAKSAAARAKLNMSMNLITMITMNKTMDGNLNTAKACIQTALESGMRLTTAQGNRIGCTVDFRKIISRLKREGFEVKSFWNTKDGRRWKTYYHTSRS